MCKQKNIHDLTFTKFRDASLPDFVKNLVEVKGHATATSLRLYPRNTPEILINLAEPIRGEMGSHTPIIKQYIIQGSKTNYVDVYHPKYCHFISIRFTPNGYYKFLSMSQKSFTNHFFNLNDVMDSEIEPLIPVLQNASSVPKRFQILINWLRREIYKREIPNHLLSDFIIKQLNRNPYLSVLQLVDQTGYTRKHLAQRFKEEVGLTIKEYQKIDRLQHVLKSISGREEYCWATMACEHGFYDQSHFIKDFKQYTACTPAEFVERKNP